MARPALVALALLLLATPGARGQDGAARPSIEARLGLTDAPRELPVDWTPVEVVVDNPHVARRLEVEVASLPAGTAPGQPRTWTVRRELSLGPDQRWRGWLFVPLDRRGGTVTATLWSVDGERAEPIARASEVDYECWETWRYAKQAAHVLVVGEDLDVGHVSWLVAGRAPARWGASAAAPVELGLRAPDALPDRAEAYGPVRVVVLRDVDLGGLSPAQQDALLAWVERGGRAVLVPGRGTAWYQNPVAQRLLRAARVVPHEVDGLAALERQYGSLLGPSGQRERFVVHEVEGATDRHLAATPLAGLEGRLRDGGRYRGLWHLPLGRGCADVLPADPALPPFDRWTGRGRYHADLREALTQGSPRAGAAPQRDAGVQAALGVRRLPPRGLVVALVVAFVVVVGPIDYLLLRRRGAQMLLVVTVPAISLCWTGLVVVTGYATKGAATITRAATLIDVDLDARAAREQTVVVLAAASEGEYEVRFGRDLLTTRVAHDREVPPAQDVLLDDEGSRHVVRMGPWTQAAFRAERTRLLPGALSLVRRGGALELHNGTDLTIEAALAHDPASGGALRLPAPLRPGGRAALERTRVDHRAPSLAAALVGEDGPRREVVARALDLWKLDVRPGVETTLLALVEPTHEVRVRGKAPDVHVALLRARRRMP